MQVIKGGIKTTNASLLKRQLAAHQTVNLSLTLLIIQVKVQMQENEIIKHASSMKFVKDVQVGFTQPE
jgi:hypothetical protein